MLGIRCNGGRQIQAVIRRTSLGSSRRSYAIQAAGPPIHQVFNRRTKWLQKERAAGNVEESRESDYLKDEVATRLCERLLVRNATTTLPTLTTPPKLTPPSKDIKRFFPRVLDLGANSCNIARALTRPNPDPDPSKPTSSPLSAHIGELVAADSSRALLYRDADMAFNDQLAITRTVLADEEGVLGAHWERGSFDMVISSLSLHWINDLPGVLATINSLLRPDAPFLGAMLGGDTLFELRTSLQLAEQERRGGVSPHVSPLADVRDVGGLLQKSGFKLLTVDVDDVVVDYPDSFALMRDLQAMGEANAVLGREMGPIGRDVLMAADAIYRELHGNEDGTVPATFRIIYMIGWREGEGQAKPLARGTGEVNLKDLLEQK
jgi:NADH dehydrogenase [ubiquinone] 1 alpha subcomplex assembly factor 5